MKSPRNLNALNTRMIDGLLSQLSPEQVRSASAVLITAAGEHFCAGHDLEELRNAPPGSNIFRHCSVLMQRVADCEVPVVAAVQGAAYAAGCQLAASCDIVLAAENARFSTPGAKIGLFCSTPAVALTRACSGKVAADLLFTGRPITASEALQAGLASRVVPATADLASEALKLCHAMAETPREVLVRGKALVQAQCGQPLAQAYALGASEMERGVATMAAKEGISAFLEKRPAAWACEEADVERALQLLSGGVAVVGASPDPSRPSYQVTAALCAQSVPVYAVNPRADKPICGLRASSSLETVPGCFSLVNIFRSAGPAAAAAVDEAVALAASARGAIHGLWLQEGVRAPEAEARARAAGLVVVADLCIKKEIERRDWRLPAAAPEAKL